MVPQDWPADDPAELVASIGRLVQFRPLIECRLAVERPIAEELVAGRMPRICTRLRDDVDHGGTRAAVLGGRTVGVDTECLHGPLTYLVRDARWTFAADRVAGNAAGVIEAVDENPVLRAWQIHHADTTGGRILRDRRGQLGKTQVPAAGNRQLLDFCFRDEGACVRPRRFHDRRMRVERDRFGQGCPAQLQIE